MPNQSIKARLDALEAQDTRQRGWRPRATVYCETEAEVEAWCAAHPGEQAVFIFMSLLPEDEDDHEPDLHCLRTPR